MALPKPLKYIRVVLHTFGGLILFILLVIPTFVYAFYRRLTGPKHVPFHSHFFIRIVYLAAAMFPYQWYHPAISIRTVLVPGARSMVVKRDTWRAYWVGTLETKKIPAETRGGSPTWKVSLKGVDIIMLYAHGGGFVFGDAEMYNNIFCSWVEHFKTVHNKKLRILSVDYDLAPKKKFPYQRDQFLSAYRFLVEEIRWNPRKIIFGGDSAGGNIILNATYVLRESRLPPPRALLCISPWIRLDADQSSSPSMAHNRKTDFMPPQVFKKIARCYAGPKEIHDPHVSPFYVKDHQKFPEMAIIYSSAEVLRDDCARFVDHYQATGGRVTYHYMVEGMPHIYPLLRELSGKTAVKDAERRLMEWVNMLVEENRILFDSRKRANAAAASTANLHATEETKPATVPDAPTPSRRYDPFAAPLTPPAPAVPAPAPSRRYDPFATPLTPPPVQAPTPTRRYDPFATPLTPPAPASNNVDLEYAQTPQISHATRIVTAQPTMTSHHYHDHSLSSESEKSSPVDLQQVVTEKPGRSNSPRSHQSGASGSPQARHSPAFIHRVGDKEEFIEDKQDDSDDEGDDDDVDLEMLVVNH
ncbi:hypothetical protein EMPS_05472 [Entomortierella parvispora]|uniref:Alpha/beta hydrolase fold-3 domain-containing protein n=1 Tax=Entomortierella parvispora TaxID=205924 RepID=A0A9P3HAI7_9FUNG|nr:hypothetical protein EMPS_05472 [Entomortierella parvispora]